MIQQNIRFGKVAMKCNHTLLKNLKGYSIMEYINTEIYEEIHRQVRAPQVNMRNNIKALV